MGVFSRIVVGILETCFNSERDVKRPLHLLPYGKSAMLRTSIWHCKNKCRISPLKKVPEHMSAILPFPTEEGFPSVSDQHLLVQNAARLQFWCCRAGIRNLSIYQPSGLLLHLLPQVQKEFGRLWTQYCHYPPPSITHGHLGDTEVDLSLRLLDRSDGRRAIARMVMQLRSDPETSNGVSREMVDAYLGKAVCSSPDLLIVCGGGPCFHGYPPWQLQRPEIFFIQDASLSSESFLGALEAYSGAEQRWGK